MEALPTVDEISIEAEDLRVIVAALNTAYHHSMALDLCDGYRKLNSRRSYSAMTKALQGALSVAEGYFRDIEVAEES